MENKKAQTAMELAVFGAILIFVIGAIVRQALSAGTTQNQSLRAMRQAMTTSYKYSSGLMGLGGDDGTASHQSANILFIEDRLTADSAKYGAIDRTPTIVSASATYSRNLFLPVDAGEDFNLPIYDIFINGRHFPFTTANFKTINLAVSCQSASPCPIECDTDGDGAGNCEAASLGFYPHPELLAANPNGWEPDCLQADVETTDNCANECGHIECVDTDGDGDPCESGITWSVTTTSTIGCAKVYDVVFNHPGFLEWCDDDASGTPCPVSLCRDICNPGFCNAAAGDCDAASAVTFPENLTADERFDLDRDGTTDVPAADRPDFSWQWFLVMGYDADPSVSTFKSGFFFFGSGASSSSNVTRTLLRGEGIVLEGSDCTDDCASPQHVSVDVDGDLKREKIMVDTKTVDDVTGIIKSFVVMDSQEGDLDFTRGDSDTGPDPGLTKDTKMYSFTRDGTYLLLEEGKLFAVSGDTSQYIRTAQKKDRIDLVERVIQLSNDTDRFCDINGNLVPTGTSGWTDAVPNPVEVCGNCFTSGNIQATCMDEANKLIFVRSRVVDRHGRKWITNTSGDDSVDFKVPPLP